MLSITSTSPSGTTNGTITDYPFYNAEMWVPTFTDQTYSGNATALVSITDVTPENNKPFNPASRDSVNFKLIGQNPAQADALSVLCRDNAPFVSVGLGFTTNFLAAAAYQESRFAQFTSIQQCSPSPLIPLTDGYPVQACDNGYGIMQLTQGVPGGLNYHLNRYTGTPTQTMIWNWVANINNGENVMLEKRGYIKFS